MTNQYMTKLYHDLLSNSPQTVTILKVRGLKQIGRASCRERV